MKKILSCIALSCLAVSLAAAAADTIYVTQTSPYAASVKTETGRSTLFYADGTAVTYPAYVTAGGKEYYCTEKPLVHAHTTLSGTTYYSTDKTTIDCYPTSDLKKYYTIIKK